MITTGPIYFMQSWLDRRMYTLLFIGHTIIVFTSLYFYMPSEYLSQKQAFCEFYTYSAMILVSHIVAPLIAQYQ